MYLTFFAVYIYIVIQRTYHTKYLNSLDLPSSTKHRDVNRNDTEIEGGGGGTLSRI